MNRTELIGRTVGGRFVIESFIGAGAMAGVYRARQVALDATVALKILHPQLSREPMFAARFLREAQAASRIDHPNSVRVVDFGEEPDGLLYIAMEYVDGQTLAKVLEEQGPLPPARVAEIASQILAALAVAHDVGVLHRDLKPENVMVLAGTDDDGRQRDLVKVCDFGVAHLLDTTGETPRITGAGVAVGTPEYMSPEQAQGEALDARSDVYSVGVLLFQMMTGKLPFESRTAVGTALMHVTDEPTRPRLLNPRADARLEEICLTAMRKAPDERYPNARELRAALRAVVDGGAVPARVGESNLLGQVAPPPARAGKVVAAVALAAVAAAGVILFRRPATEPAPAAQPQMATLSSAAPPTQSPAPAHPTETPAPLAKADPAAGPNTAPAPAAKEATPASDTARAPTAGAAKNAEPAKHESAPAAQLEATAAHAAAAPAHPTTGAPKVNARKQPARWHRPVGPRGAHPGTSPGASAGGTPAPAAAGAEPAAGGDVPPLPVFPDPPATPATPAAPAEPPPPPFVPPAD